MSSAASAVVMGLCVAMVSALMLMSVARQREHARSMVCANNLKRIGLALHNYASTYQAFPFGSGGSSAGTEDETKGNASRLSPFVGLLPFLEQTALWDQIANRHESPNGQAFPAMGPVPWFDETAYSPWAKRPAVYACPLDRVAVGGSNDPTENVFDSVSSTYISYVTNYGDGSFVAGAPDEAFEKYPADRASKRGVFRRGGVYRFRDVLDGTTNTLFLSETRVGGKGATGISGIVKGVAGLSKKPSLCLTAATADDAQWWPEGRGSRWADGALPVTGFQAILPPNSPSCTSELGLLDGVVSASSHHAGGVMVLFCDGHIRFATDSIDTGDNDRPGVALAAGYTQAGEKSPYGIWGALGSRAAGETIAQTPHLTGPPSDEPEPTLDDAPQEVSNQPLRVWQDTTGTKTIRAQFVRIEDRKTVVLIDAGGQVRRLPLNMLSSADIFHAVRTDVIARNRESE